MTSQTPTVVEKGPQQVSRSIVVDAPASEIFDVLVHPGRHHEIDGSGTVRDAAGDEARMVQGETFTVRMKMFGVPYRITSTATEVVPDRVVEWQHPGKHRWRYDFEPIGPDRTRVTETWDYRDSPAARVFELIGYPKRNASGIESTLVRLAERYGG